MHLKIFIFVTLVALGGAARQSWKSTNSEKNGNTHWKKGLNSATKSPLLNINYDYSQKKVPSQRKEVKKLESPTKEFIVPKCSGILQQEKRSRGTRVESDKLDLDITSARVPAGYVAVGSFDETSPMLLKPSGSYSKKPFEAIKKSKKLAEDPGSDEQWNLVQKKLKDLYNVLTVESSSLPITSGQSIQIKTRQKSVSSKSQIGASDHTASKAAEKVEPKRDSEKLVELEDCAVRSYFNLPVRETLATDGYEHSKKGMKCSSDRMADLYVDSIADRPMDVHEQGSTESSTLSARLAGFEDELADLRQLLLDHELDEPVLRQN